MGPTKNRSINKYYSLLHKWNALNSTGWWDLTVQEYPWVEFIFKASGANRSLEATWSSWVGVKRYSIKKAESFFPLQKALLLHHGYQSLIFDFSWPFSIKNVIATVRVTDPDGWSTTLTHPLHPPHREVRTLLTRVCRPNISLHLTWHFQLHCLRRVLCGVTSIAPAVCTAERCGS